MAQFPFAQVYEMTYRLKDGKLECATQVTNLGNSELPVHFAFHPYFHPDGPREEWKLTNGAQKHWIVTKQLIPTGETEPTDKFLPGVTKGVALGKTFIDDGFSEFRRDAKGLGHVVIQGKAQKIEVLYGKGFDYAIVYAPLNKSLICAEPQTGPTNAFNLQHEGKFKNLIILAPGKTFGASFWIAPTGF
jgi:galactose mutarotase-like enzyme